MRTHERRVQESQEHREFNLQHADDAYRCVHAVLYPAHKRFSEEYFRGQLSIPHLRYGMTASRKLGNCLPYTGNGAPYEITIHQGLTVDLNPEWVQTDWQSPDLQIFVAHLLYRFGVRQAVCEGINTDGSRGEGCDEAGYEGFGPRFCQHANRISLRNGWPQVVVRHNGPEDAGKPLAKYWPHCVMPEGYYNNALTQAALDLACGSDAAGTLHPAPPSLGLLELLLYLLVNNQSERARELLIRHIDRLQRNRLGRQPRISRAERGLDDVDGSPLGKVEFNPAWLVWYDGIVRKIAQSILLTRSFIEMPILADALEEAGCDDGRILRHLRASMEHTRSCWCLHGLLKVKEDKT
jgi:hypothetical protein